MIRRKGAPGGVGTVGRWAARNDGRFPGRGHGARMKIAFAVIDADSNGTVTLQEAQDLQARISAGGWG